MVSASQPRVVLPTLMQFVETAEMAKVRFQLIDVLSQLESGSHTDDSWQLIASYDELAEARIAPLQGQERRLAQIGLMMAKSEIFRMAKWFATQDEKWDEAWEQAVLEDQKDEFQHATEVLWRHNLVLLIHQLEGDETGAHLTPQAPHEDQEIHSDEGLDYMSMSADELFGLVTTLIDPDGTVDVEAYLADLGLS